MTGADAKLLTLAVSTQERLRRDGGATAVERGLAVRLGAVAITATVSLPSW